MPARTTKQLRLPDAPRSIEKGSSLKGVLGPSAIECLAHNVSLAHPSFDGKAFVTAALAGLEPLGIMERGPHIAQALRQFLPNKFSQAIKILLDSLTPPLAQTEGNGLAVFFYHPHTSFVAEYGLDPQFNGGRDPFPAAMQAQYQLTQRFSAEFSIRRFLLQQPERTLAQLTAWTSDHSPHVRRLCSEGTRPRLPWGVRLAAIAREPGLTLPILETLKDDPSLYVRRSVANHLGDIAKDHLDMVLDICDRWLRHASTELKWVVRHALRHPAKQRHTRALKLRASAR